MIEETRIRPAVFQQRQTEATRSVVSNGYSKQTYVNNHESKAQAFLLEKSPKRYFDLNEEIDRLNHQPETDQSKQKKHKYEGPQGANKSIPSQSYIDDDKSETSQRVKSNKYEHVQSRLFDKPKAFKLKEEQQKEMVNKMKREQMLSPAWFMAGGKNVINPKDRLASPWNFEARGSPKRYSNGSMI